MVIDDYTHLSAIRFSCGWSHSDCQSHAPVDWTGLFLAEIATLHFNSLMNAG